MGNCFQAEDQGGAETKNTREEREKQKSRSAEIPEADIVTMKLKIQRDRMDTRMKAIQKDEKALSAKIKTELQAGNKLQAKFALSKRKLISAQYIDYSNRALFIEKQINNIERMQDDAQFTKTLAASNKVLTDLKNEIDLEEIETAKALNQEFDMQNKEMNEMLVDDEDDDLMDEINQMEAAMQNKNFDEVDGEINTNHKQMHRKQTMAKHQEMMAM